MSLLRIARKFRPDQSLVLLNLEQIIKSVDKTEKEIIERMLEAGSEMQSTLVTQVQDRTPVESGNLKGSIQEYTETLKVEAKGNSVRFPVGTNVVYAEAVEFGVKGRTYTYNVEGLGDVAGVGAAMFRKTLDSRKDNKELEDILISKLRS